MKNKVLGILGMASFALVTASANVAVAAPPPAAPMSVAMSAAACNDGNNRNVKIINETGVQMREFYGSPAGVDNWEEDILGSQILGGYQSININFDDDRCLCIYDFKAVFTDGDVLVKERVNVCEISSYRYY